MRGTRRAWARPALLTALFAGVTAASLHSPHPGPAPFGLPSAQAQALPTDTALADAREAARKRDKPRLAQLRQSFEAAGHPLAGWVGYWDLNARLREATPDEVDSFRQRWAGQLVAERLGQEWGLELGRRRDFPALAALAPSLGPTEQPELRCWLLLAEHLAGREVTSAARQAWLAQREPDQGCLMLATAMVDRRLFSTADVWAKARLSVDQQRPAVAKAAWGLMGNSAAREAAEALDTPARFLRRSGSSTANHEQLRALAIARLAADEPGEALAFLSENPPPGSTGAWAWAQVGRQAAFRQMPEAAEHYQRALSLQRGVPELSDDTLAWGVRAALRGLPPATRWPLVLQLVGAMTPTAQQDPAWQFWRAQALRASTRRGEAGQAERAEGQRLLATLAGLGHAGAGPAGTAAGAGHPAQPAGANGEPAAASGPASLSPANTALSFYGLLAADSLGQTVPWPPQANPPTAAERDAARQHPGLQRAWLLLGAGLRDEGRREWNHALRGMDDRALLAAASQACERQDWQLCINTAERTRHEVDLALRYPQPRLQEIRAAAQSAGLEPALVLGLIRQETRFMTTLRSSVGATGLMQVMPGTATLVARRLGLSCCSPEQLADPGLNLRLGTAYLRQQLDDFGGSQALAAAAYNAGPGRPRRWREGATLDAAAWTENVPFLETRDYVKRVLTGAAVYAALHTQQPPTLRPRLGQTIGPREAEARPAEAPGSAAGGAASEVPGGGARSGGNGTSPQ